MSITPRGELAGDDFLNGLAIGEVRRTARAAPNEVALAQRQTGGQIGRLDESGDAPVTCRRQPEPVPAALDDLAEGTDRDAFTVGANESVPFDVPQCGWRPAPTEPDRDRHALGTDTIDVSESRPSTSKVTPFG
jgi:hypothetical protein